MIFNGLVLLFIFARLPRKTTSLHWESTSRKKRTRPIFYCLDVGHFANYLHRFVELVFCWSTLACHNDKEKGILCDFFSSGHRICSLPRFPPLRKIKHFRRWIKIIRLHKGVQDFLLEFSNVFVAFCSYSLHASNFPVNVLSRLPFIYHLSITQFLALERYCYLLWKYSSRVDNQSGVIEKKSWCFSFS